MEVIGIITCAYGVTTMELLSRSGEPKPLLITGIEYFVQHFIESFSRIYQGRIFAPELAQEMSRFRKLSTLAKYLPKVNLWYQIGGSIGPGRVFKLANLFNTPVVLHWVGTDVLVAQDYFSKHSEHLQVQSKIVHWAGAPWLADELKQIGINAQFVPLPLKTVGYFLSQEPPPLPRQFKILTYIPERRAAFYGWEHILRLAEDFPTLDILVIGARGRFVSSPPPNIHFLGWLHDTANIFAECSVVVRMTTHDGYGGTIQEGLSLGRYAIWTYPFPGAFLAKDYVSLRAHIDSLYTLHRRNLLTLNEKGRAYMLQHMRPENLTANILRRFQNLLSPGTQ